MVRPLDHVTVIQQINFAEKVHQNQQFHPELSKLQSEVIDQQKREIERRKTQSVHKSERTRIHLRDEQNHRRGRKGGERRKKGLGGGGRSIDLKA